jgi:poly(hydroxyalkanoate) depolymerase family esterase
VKDSFRNLMQNVQRLTRSGRLAEATAAIQRALGGGGAARSTPSSPPAAAPSPAAPAMDGDVIDVEARFIDDPVVDEAVVDELFMPPPAAAPAEPPSAEPISPALDETARGEFIAGSFSSAAGSRAYKLYVPSGPRVGPLPLVVMLHGCKQNPDDFAVGTGMNRLAEANGWLVLYPAQSQAVNRLGCWNWFKAEDQQRGVGEPAIIAGMTQHIVDTHAADPRRVYVAGLSAGGAMADIMATTYPDLYAAAGIHSGLAHAAAHDLMSALNAMRQGPRERAGGAAQREPVPTIVFHGDSDTTVHPSNGERVIANAQATAPSDPKLHTELGQVPGGRSYTRTIVRDDAGLSSTEHWVVHGAGHAWSGGHANGSYTDPLGPDASAQMLRFFLEHPKAG